MGGRGTGLLRTTFLCVSLEGFTGVDVDGRTSGNMSSTSSGLKSTMASGCAVSSVTTEEPVWRLEDDAEPLTAPWAEVEAAH